MVSMSGAMGAGSAASYFEKDNYYLKDGLTEKGQWFGDGAERMNLKGEVSMDQFKALANGYDHTKLDANHLKTLDQFSKTEASLAHQMDKALKAGDDKKAGELQEKIKEFNGMRAEFDKSLPEGAKLIRDGKDENGMTTHRGGFDITFSAPKSVSVMALVGDDKRLISAHQDAANKAMSYIQESFAQTRERNGDGTRDRVNTGELSVAQFTHYTSRGVDGQTPDPQLHTHNFVFNVTHTQDGKAMSLEPQQIYAHQKLADQIYQNELTRNVEKLGYGVTWEKHGQNYTMQIKGVDREVMDHFSKRDDQINVYLEAKEKELGRALTAEEIAVLKLETRSDKEVGNMEQIKENWSTQLNERGYSAESIKEATNNQVSDKNNIADAKEVVNQGIKTLDDQKSVFNQHEIVFESLKAGRGTVSLDEIKSSIKKGSDAVSLNHTATRNDRTELYTSKDIQAAENRIMEGLEKGKGATNTLLSKEAFNQATGERESFTKLTDGQKEAVELIATSGDRFVAVQGAAGSGKTSMLVELKGLLDEKLQGKVEITGLAATGKAAAEIQEKGIESKTLDSFFSKPTDQMPSTDGKQQVWIVDEASMLDTKKFEQIIERAEALDAKVVFIGDTKQLKAIGAGDMFSKAQETGAIVSAKMEESVRQNYAADGIKDIVSTFRDIERVKEGMDKLHESGRIVEAEKKIDENGKETRDIQPVKDQLIDNASKDYMNKGLNSTIVLVNTNSERSEFNGQIREGLKEAGVIGKEDHSLKTLESKSLNRTDSKLAMSYDKGDVLISKQMQGDIKAGMRAEVTGIDKDNNRIQISYERANGTTAEKWIDAENGERFNAYRETEKQFSDGEKITFTKNDNNLGVKNGETAIIKSIGEDGTITAEKGGKEMTFDSKEYEHFDHAYAMTTHKSQGQSVENVHVYATSDQGMNNHNAGYVQVSRTTYDLKVYTDNKEALAEKYSDAQLKENAMDYSKADLKEISDAAKGMDAEKVADMKSFDDKISDLRDDLEKSIESAKDDFSAKLDALMDNKEISSATEVKIEEMEKIGATERELLNTLDETKDEAKEVEKEVERGE